MKPLSKTDTTASARGFNSPLTLIWIVAFADRNVVHRLAMPRRCSVAGELATAGRWRSILRI